ncbi:MAG: nickel pincer cofactor biosynthesis protein LarB [Candidatus Helarchaeota archaeon]
MKTTREILEDFKIGKISIEEAEKIIKANRIVRLENFVNIDMERELRTGIPEIVYSASKSPDQAAKIAIKIAQMKKFSIMTKVSEEHTEIIRKFLPKELEIEVNKLAKMIIVRKKGFKFEENRGNVGIITAGTSDIPIAEEAKIICESMGCSTTTFYDIGIAGLHRIFPPLKKLMENDVDVVVVCAGFEGLLAGVISSLIDVPVIGVPTSIGYGVSEKGFSALNTMLSSCSPFAVVNIDNGFSAGVMAAKIANRIAYFRNKLNKIE